MSCPIWSLSLKLDDEDSILPPKLQSALENVLERRRELANERGDTPSGNKLWKIWRSRALISCILAASLLNTCHNFFIPDSGHLSTVMSEAFVRFFVELVGHYPLFITGEREDGYSSSSSSPVPCSFQREGFRKAIPSKTVRRFLEVFMETQMFGWFIQERELHRQALKGRGPAAGSSSDGGSRSSASWFFLFSQACLKWGCRSI